MDRSKWEYKKLGEVAKISSGKAIPSSEISEIYIEGFYPCYGGNGLRGYVNQYSNDGFIPVIGRVGALCGNVHLPQEKFYATEHALVVNLKANDKPHFIEYLLSALNLRQYAKGVAQPVLSASTLSEILIPIPPLSDQQRIVAELDCLNEMIAVKQKQLKEFDKLAQSIFYDMFESIDKYVPASHYIDSLGGGKSLAGEVECTNKVLKTGAVTYDYFKEDEVKNLPIDYQPLEEHLLKDGDLLVSRMNTLEYVGAIAYVWKAPQNTYLPDRLWRAKLKSGANPIYLWYSLKQDKAKEQIRAKASGTSGSMKNISMPKFLSTTIKDAPLALQQQFADKISAIEAQKELVKQSIAETQALLDYTMDQYFGLLLSDKNRN